ncbi:hypothetical protein PRIPAC_94707 [Pristionchus pacificus]|uniref:Uncharacterized protein n=1 Tax=Pristionchus pacificus TaxID=54126 RepID=A0A2A6CHQ1_PRIPA|nr:hypothetical protein PRIPAC_94707 [Pristionchus pacificus]|eukprot:PDM77551.1 hypothetical protein PRIPAC_34418 [Pristionchus pacificus]
MRKRRRKERSRSGKRRVRVRNRESLRTLLFPRALSPALLPVATSTRAPYEGSHFDFRFGFHPISQVQYPFPQLGINQAYVPATSSTYIAYKPYSDCLRARVRLTICGPQLDRLLDATSPHGRTISGPYSDCLQARVRLTICGPRLDRLLDVTVPTWSYHPAPELTLQIGRSLSDLGQTHRQPLDLAHSQFAIGVEH